jgi:hypothetical protein
MRHDHALRTASLAEISKAHKRLESNETFGKVVVVME